MSSIWTESVKRPKFEPIGADIKTDVLIIGGGIAGLLCAYMLKQAGVDCVLVEQNEICGGVTKDTTAKITSQHGLIYSKLVQEFGPEQARLYLRANEDALESYRKLCRGVDCDFQTREACVYSLDDRRALEREMEALQAIGHPARLVHALALPFPVKGAVCFENQAQFHPLKFLYAVAKDLPVFEHTQVLELKPGQAVTRRGKIRAEKIIVTTHFPFLNKHGSYFLKLYQHRSYVLALRNAPNVRGMFVDASETGLSFRNHGDLLLLGGGGHRTGKAGGGWAELEKFARRNYPNAKVVSRWATQDCMTLDGIPYVGQYSKRTPDLYVATGFNKWGMTSAMVAATLLCDLVRGRENVYQEVFSPWRRMYLPRLALNAGQSALHLLTPTAPRCPHMGCALKYNRQEHTWDCPCHGSRFSEDGERLDNPATGPLDSGRENGKR